MCLRQHGELQVCSRKVFIFFMLLMLLMECSTLQLGTNLKIVHSETHIK